MSNDNTPEQIADDLREALTCLTSTFRLTWEQSKLLRDTVTLIESQAAELAAAKKDAERFDFWFSPKKKSIDIDQYMNGYREHWSPNQWRAYIDIQIEMQPSTTKW